MKSRVQMHCALTLRFVQLQDLLLDVETAGQLPRFSMNHSDFFSSSFNLNHCSTVDYYSLSVIYSLVYHILKLQAKLSHDHPSVLPPLIGFSQRGRSHYECIHVFNPRESCCYREGHVACHVSSKSAPSFLWH